MDFPYYSDVSFASDADMGRLSIDPTEIGSIIIGKSEPENKEQTSGNTPL